MMMLALGMSLNGSDGPNVILLQEPKKKRLVDETALTRFFANHHVASSINGGDLCRLVQASNRFFGASKKI
jgi:hypothetical protein